MPTRPDATAGLAAERFISETAEIVHAREPIQMRATLYTLALLLLSLLGVSLVFRIDRVVTTEYGEIRTTQPTYVLDALDASIIKSLEVREGELVKAGQQVATLDATFTSADANALRLQIASLDAQIARAEAELNHQDLVIARSDVPGAEGYAAIQSALYQQRKAQYEQQIHAYDEQIAQAEATLRKLARDQELYHQRDAIAREVEDMRRELERREVGSRLNRLGAEDTKLEIERNLEFDHSAMSETAHQLAATIANRDAFAQQHLADTSQELVSARNERDTAREQLAKAARHQELVRVTAPEDAIVLSIPKVSVGSVLKEGDRIMNLALLGSPVLAQVHIAARDIGFVRAGDAVTIKFDAFNFVEHGTATGRVDWISEGTFNTDAVTGSNLDSEGRPVPPYYEAGVALESVALHDVPDSFRVIPGMTLTADIHVGERSLFMYLVRGLVRSTGEAMREP